MNISARFKQNFGSFNLDVELELPGTGVSAIFGESGGGKTTLLRTMAGLHHVPDGYLKVGNHVWQNEQLFVPVHQRSIAYVFQEASLFTHLNVRQNIEYGAKRNIRESDIAKSVDKVIELFGLVDLIQRDTSSLSGGERQRVAIARALASRPCLMLMDEPLASLDVNRKQDILPLIGEASSTLGIPIIYVSHSTDEIAQLANHIALLKEGSIIGSGNIQKMLTNLHQPLAHSDDAEAIVDATIVNHDAEFQLSYLDFGGGQFTVSQIARPVGSTVRLRIAARDVSLTLNRQSETSILNIFSAKVDEIAEEGSAQMTVRVLLGDVPLLARITRKSAAVLDLHVGKSVFVQAKSAAVLI
jgi:molybdate transport system ATP-binding protein